MKKEVVINELRRKHWLGEKSTVEEVIEKYEKLTGRKYTKKIEEIIRNKGEMHDRKSNIFILLVYSLAYPALKIKNRAVEQPKSFYWKNRIQPYTQQINNYANSVGRIVYRHKGGKLVSLASGFMISDDLLLTTAKLFMENTTEKKYWVDFSEGKKLPEQEEIFESRGFTYLENDPNKELVFLKLKTYTASGKKLPPPLSIAIKNKKTDFVITISYPLKMRKQSDVIKQYAAFGSPWQMGYKRVSLGHLSRIEKDQCYHDCNISIGSEGAPVIDPATGEVIGVNIGRSFEGQEIAYALVAYKNKPGS